jgi:hypothetical protein
MRNVLALIRQTSNAGGGNWLGGFTSFLHTSDR